MKQQKRARLLYSCFSMRRQLAKLIEKADISLGEYLVLRNIWLSNYNFFPGGREGSVKAADLSDLLELSRPAITRILNSLENRGFIVRNVNKKDRRSFAIELTETGIEAIEKANRRILGFAGKLAELLGDSETDKLIELIDRLSNILKEMTVGDEISDDGQKQKNEID